MPKPPEDEHHDDPYNEPPPPGRGSTHAGRQGGGRSGNRPGGGSRGGSGGGPRGGNGGGGGPRGGAGGKGRGSGPPPRDPDDRSYNVYSSRPRGLFARLRGESDSELEDRAQERAARKPPARQSGKGGKGNGQQGSGPAPNGYDRSGRATREPDRGTDFGEPTPGARGPGSGRGGASRGGAGLAAGGLGGSGRGGGNGEAGSGRRPPRRRRRLLRPRAPGAPGGKLAFLAFLTVPIVLPWLTPWRLIKTFILALIGWVVLSIVLFFVSASTNAGKLPAGAQSSLTSSGPILTSANNILILGLDNRPTTGYSSKEGGAQHSQATARTDTIMLWRVGGGVSRRLSIPRDTLVNIPGHGKDKINAAWPYGGPKLTIDTVEQLTGVKINHLIIVDLGNFPKFINDIGGVTVKTGRICSKISGGRKNGGYNLFLKPGYHHLSGVQAMTLARTRENLCNPAYNDLNREAAQQEILNGIKSQLFTVHTFLHLPWASWDAPQVIQTDMGGLSLMELFAAAQIGGSSKPRLLKETGSVYNGQDVLIPNASNVRKEVNRLMTGK